MQKMMFWTVKPKFLQLKSTVLGCFRGINNEQNLPKNTQTAYYQ